MQRVVPNKHCFYPSCCRNHVSQDRLQLICQGPNSWPHSVCLPLTFTLGTQNMKDSLLVLPSTASNRYNVQAISVAIGRAPYNRKLNCCILLSSFLRQNALTVPQNPFSPHARVTKIAGEFLHWHVFASLHFSHGRTICLHRIWSFIHIHPSQQNTSESIASILLSLPFTISDCSRPRGPETCQGQTCWMQSIVPNKHCFFPSCRKTHSLAKNHVSQDRLQLICQGPNSWPLTMSVSLWLLRWAHKTWKIAY